MDIKNKDIELIKLNYQNLHDSVWNCHKISWTVTSIFIPILFTLLGYFIKEYELLSKFHVILIATVMELLIFVWWLIMRIFEHYNDLRVKKLRKIEKIFNKQVSEGVYLFEQYREGFGYKQKIKELKISPSNIYHITFAGYTIINIILVCKKFL